MFECPTGSRSADTHSSWSGEHGLLQLWVGRQKDAVCGQWARSQQPGGLRDGRRDSSEAPLDSPREGQETLWSPSEGVACGVPQ